MKIQEILEAFDPRTGKEIVGFDPYAYHDLANPQDEEVRRVKKAKHLVKIITQNCSTMLAAYKNSKTYLYRGIGSEANTIITAIRPDRRPVQLDPEIHEALHKGFLTVGLTATRKNSIFCSSQFSVANDWGSDVYIIFVKDGWSGTVFDKSDHNDYTFYPLVKLGQQYQYNVNMEVMSEEQAMQELIYGIKNLGPRAFRTSQELKSILAKEYADIIITGDSYIGLRLHTPITKEVLSRLGI